MSAVAEGKTEKEGRKGEARFIEKVLFLVSQKLEKCGGRRERREKKGTRWFILPPRKSGEWQNFFKEGKRKGRARIRVA